MIRNRCFIGGLILAAALALVLGFHGLVAFLIGPICGYAFFHAEQDDEQATRARTRTARAADGGAK